MTLWNRTTPRCALLARPDWSGEAVTSRHASSALSMAAPSVSLSGPRVYAAARRIRRQRLQAISHLFAAAPRRSQAPRASATFKGLEPLTGIEPALPAWKAGVLPLHHSGMVPGAFGAAPGCKKEDYRGGVGSSSPWSSRSDSNRRPADYKSAALPTELQERVSLPTRIGAWAGGVKRM